MTSLAECLQNHICHNCNSKNSKDVRISNDWNWHYACDCGAEHAFQKLSNHWMYKWSVLTDGNTCMTWNPALNVTVFEKMMGGPPMFESKELYRFDHYVSMKEFKSRYLPLIAFW